MVPKNPQVARRRDNRFLQLRDLVLVCESLDRILLCQETGEFVVLEAREAQVKVRFLQVQQLEGEQLVIPLRPRYGSVHHESERFDLRLRPLIAENNRHLADAKLLSSFEAQVTINDLTIAAGEHRDLEAELADAATHTIHDRIVLPWVACVEDETVNGPDLNLVGLSRRLLREHTSPSDGSDWRCLSEGALCAGLANRASDYILLNKSSSRCERRRSVSKNDPHAGTKLSTSLIRMFRSQFTSHETSHRAGSVAAATGGVPLCSSKQRIGD